MTNLTINRRADFRSGISLLEVLISMFVLLFGLMGVAAIFPVGNHYAGRSEQFDRGSALAEAGFADLKARGLLKPELWYYADQLDANNDLIPDSLGTAVENVDGSLMFPLTAGNPGPGHAFVIDPMGAVQFDADPIDRTCFPFGDKNNLWTNPPSPGIPLPGSRWPIQRVTLPADGVAESIPMTEGFAETVTLLHDDITNEFPKESDRPGVQRWTADSAGFSQDEPWRHKLLSRQYGGSYSWIATVVPSTNYGPNALQPFDNRFKNELYEVSVAVLRKREVPLSAETERMINARFLFQRELQLFDPAGDPDVFEAAIKDIRPGQWLAVTGVHPTTGQFLLKWYRILSLNEDDGIASLEGPEWPAPTSTSNPSGFPVEDLRAILLTGVISVSTQMLPMESVQ